MNPQILDEYSRLCDEVEEFMQEENASLRMHGGDGSEWVERKKTVVSRLDELLSMLRQEAFRESLHPGPVAALRDLVMKKLLKLLLLSRENEQLLLKNSMPRRPQAQPPSAFSFRAAQGAYRSAA